MKISRYNAPHFTHEEFSEDPRRHAEPELIYKLQRQRDILDAPIYPSKAKGALARFKRSDGRSKHYAVGRKSTAIDWFTDLPPFETWVKIIKSGLWVGVGIYFDTEYKRKSRVMFHTDYGRNTPLCWLRYSEPVIENGAFIGSERIYVYDKYNDEFYDTLLSLLSGVT